MLIVGIQEDPVSTEGDQLNVIVTRGLIEPSIPVFVTVTTRRIPFNPDDIPHFRLASEDGRSSP